MPPKRKGEDDIPDPESKLQKLAMDEDEEDGIDLDQLLETMTDDEEDQIHRATTKSAIRFVNERVTNTSSKLPTSLPSATTGITSTENEGIADYSQTLSLKKDHSSRPLWIDPDTGYIILEAFSPIAEQAQDFLVAIAEPVSRPTHIHEYRLTAYSLYAAVSVGLEVENIISVLNRLSKTDVPISIINFIKNFTVSYGKIKLVLKHNRYYIESEEPEILQTLLKDPIIRDARKVHPVSHEPSSLLNEKAPTLDFKLPGTSKTSGQENATDAHSKAKQSMGLGKSHAEGTNLKSGTDNGDIENEDLKKKQQEEEEDRYLYMILEKEETVDASETVHSFEIEGASVEAVKKHCNEINFPMLEEYDFRNDSTTKNLEIDLKPFTQIRPYQEKSLSKMFGNGRARSGIIVLPCGAGKTLVGITAACTIRKSTLVLCTSAVSVSQWRQQFLTWSNISDKKIAAFTSDTKHWFEGEAGIVISTYTMVANTRKRAYDTSRIMDLMRKTEWGFLLLDEVHVVPANMFRRVLTQIAAHTKLGLTATLVREDDRISDLNFLIGPKLYEANWMDLASQGHIARVQCAEVWCDMTPEFFRQYLHEHSRRRQVLYAMNPNKFQACQFLIHYHEARGDKIIVFSDNVYALKAYATKLAKPFIYGATSHAERTAILQQLQYNPACNTIFLSKVGDTSIDLPEATCLIQISSHYGSRRQEAQRLGRILRAKRRNDEGFNAFFYSLVSKDTEEMYYSNKRQQFLVDQGYAFKVITQLEGLEHTPGLCYSTLKEQEELLVTILNARETDLNEDDFTSSSTQQKNTTNTTTSSLASTMIRKQANLTSLSGGDTMAYMQIKKTR